MTMTIARLGVVIPAADEADHIDACLRAIAVAAQQVAIPVDVVVVLDGCTDDTAALVARHPAVELLAVARGGVGAARALGSAAVLAGHDPATVWTVHTDADSVVPPHWLSGMLARAAGGAEVVLGTIDPDFVDQSAVRHRWLQHHDRHDGHGHVHGANLGVRGDVLCALGGWPALPTGEDVELVALARAAGRNVVAVGDLAVRTSARYVGRAPDGLASYLRRLRDLGKVARADFFETPVGRFGGDVERQP